MPFVAKLSLASAPAYAWWRLKGSSTPVRLKLAGGPRFELRGRTRTCNDYGTAYEVFVLRYYDIPTIADHNRVRLIVDLGSNVGLTCLYWLANYPQANIIAYEPHPAHVDQCKRNLALNRWTNRVELHSAAAGTRAQRVQLTDAGTSSSVRDGKGGIGVAMEDLFARVGTDSIDILKMDIEGGEYPILEDDRFAKLSVEMLIMEWHRSSQPGRNGAWCRTRLDQLGFEVSFIFEADDHGMLRARKRSGARAANDQFPGLAADGESYL